jgi:hypothetical protein
LGIAAFCSLKIFVDWTSTFARLISSNLVQAPYLLEHTIKGCVVVAFFIWVCLKIVCPQFLWITLW